MHRAPVLALTATLPASTLAHPGHDHAHFLSPAIHGLLFLALAGACVFAARAILLRRRAARTAKQTS